MLYTPRQCAYTLSVFFEFLCCYGDHVTSSMLPWRPHCICFCLLLSWPALQQCCDNSAGWVGGWCFPNAVTWATASWHLCELCHLVPKPRPLMRRKWFCGYWALLLASCWGLPVFTLRLCPPHMICVPRPLFLLCKCTLFKNIDIDLTYVTSCQDNFMSWHNDIWYIVAALVPRPLFFVALPLPCIIWRIKMGEAWEGGYSFWL